MINSSLEFEGREFRVHVTRDGDILFDDYTYRVRNRAPGRDQLELKTLAGDSEARRALQEELDAHTFAVGLDSSTMSFFEVAADLLAREKWTLEHSAKLERIMTEIFWQHVNHRLARPISRA